MKIFLIAMFLVLSACVQESKNEWLQLQQILSQENTMITGKLRIENREKILKIISDVIVRLQSLTFQKSDLELLKNKKIKYYQTIFQLIMTTEQTEKYQRLEQQLLDISQQSYQLEKYLEQEYTAHQ